MIELPSPKPDLVNPSALPAHLDVKWPRWGLPVSSAHQLSSGVFSVTHQYPPVLLYSRASVGQRPITEQLAVPRIGPGGTPQSPADPGPNTHGHVGGSRRVPGRLRGVGVVVLGDQPGDGANRRRRGRLR